MKNLLSLFLLTLLLTSSCSKEKDEEEPMIENSFTYNGATYDINSFGLFFYNTNHFKMIFSTGNYDASCDCLVGIDEIEMNVDIYSYQNGDVASGIYTNSSSNDIGTFEGGYESFSDKITYEGVLDWGNVTGGNNSNIVGGQLEIDNSNSIYTIEYTFNLADGKVISGTFKGAREFFWID